MRDIISRLNARLAFEPKAAVTDNTAQVSTIIDTAGYEGVALMLVLGTLTDVDATFAVSFEASDASNMAGAEVPTADQLNGTIANANFTFAADLACRKIGYVGPRRYLRATVTPTGHAAGNLFMAGIWLLAGGRFNPQPVVPA